jgi:signal peptidase II
MTVFAKKNWLILVIICLDQLTKILLKSYFPSLTVLNKGISFGLFPFSGWTLINFLLLLVLIRFLPQGIGKSLIIGGGFSNLLDRIIWGGVVDFINLKPGFLNLDMPTFNMADFLIVSGTVLLIFSHKITKKE